MRPRLCQAIPLTALFACGVAVSAAASEPGRAWQLTPRIEHSQVTVNGNDGQWDAWSLAVAHVAASGSRIEGTIGRQDRNGLSDDELHLSTYARAGAWDATASVQISPDAHFLPEWSYELDVDRGVAAHVRAGAGYRRMQFDASSVNLVSTHATFYRGDDEWGVEYRFGRNAELDHDIRVLQAHAALLRGRNRFGAYLARGDYLFDALGIAGGSGRGWSATVAFARSLSPSTTLRVEAGAGGEADTFRQRTVAVSLQYSP